MIVWKPVVGYEGFYSVSNSGLVRSEDRIVVCKNGVTKHRQGKIIAGGYNKGYLLVFLSKNGLPKAYQVHRLIAEAFIPNPKKLPCINHKNGIRDDNRVENLEWCTYSENNKHSYIVLKRKPTWLGCFEDKNPMAKRVIQFLKDGSFKEYSCAIRASKETSIPAKNICATCRGEQHTAGGFVWKWK